MAIPDQQANAMQDGVNAVTGPLRQQAFDEALKNPSYRDEMAKYLISKANEPGVRESSAMPLINRAKDSLIIRPREITTVNGGIPKTITNNVPTAHPADLYTLKKELADKLALKTVSPDELTNAAKGNRRTAYDIMQNVDNSLNESSGGKWDTYNKAYAAKIAPVTEGRAFQDVLNKFDLSKPIYGTETPQLTARALRKAVADETYMNQGKKGYVSTISENARAKTDDVIKTINAIEQAKAGPRGTSGSQTADNIASLAKSALSAGGGMTSKALQVAHALGVTRGARKIDEAMLNPDKLPTLIAAYNKRMETGNIPDTRISEMIRRLTQNSLAGAQNE
jgi:hypothetical protein